METDTADRLRRALLEAGFTEAAALVGADIDAQEAEEAEELDDDNVVRANFADFEGPERTERRVTVRMTTGAPKSARLRRAFTPPRSL